MTVDPSAFTSLFAFAILVLSALNFLYVVSRVVASKLGTVLISCTFFSVSKSEYVFSSSV